MIGTLSHISRILLPSEKRRLGWQLLLDVVINILDIGFMAMLVYVLNFYTVAQMQSGIPLLNAYPLLPITVFAVLFAVKNIVAHAIISRQYYFAYTVAARLSRQKLLQYLKGNFRDHVHTDSSVWLRSISQQPIEFGHHVLAGWQQIAGQSILVLLTATAICLYNPLLFLLLTGLLSVPVILTALFLKKKLAHIRNTAKPVSEKTIQYLHEAVAGYVESNIYQKHDFFTRRYSSYQESFNRFLSRQLAVQHIPSRLLEIFAVLGLLLLIVAGHYSHGGGVPLVTVAAFMAGAYKIIPGIVKILNSIGQIRTYSFTTEALLPGAGISAGMQPARQRIESIALQHVAYHADGKPVLRDCSFHLQQGDMLGVSGLSGKGKTTLVNLIPGFLEPASGDVLINNSITSCSEREGFRDHIAYVKQQQFLLHDSIRNNIILDDGPCDTEKLGQVVKATGLDQLSGQYPEGLDKVITENGRNISGGQRQRIAIARALYKDADLILLDEPFNELDKASETRLLQYFTQLANNGKMIILISHNRESLSWCNKTLSLDEN